jgi:hypothetical protein
MFQLWVPYDFMLVLCTCFYITIIDIGLSIVGFPSYVGNVTYLNLNPLGLLGFFLFYCCLTEVCKGQWIMPTN